MAKTPYASVGWRKVRGYVLERDGYECRLRLPGCTGHAESADHIQPIEHGGAWLDPDNLRASCTHCNSVRGNQTRGTPGEPGALAASRDW